MIKQACRFVSLVADDVKANDLYLTSPCGKEIGIIHIQDEKFYFKTLNNGNVTSAYNLGIPPGTNFGEYMYWDNSQSKWRIEGNKVRLGTDAGKNQGGFSIAIGAKAGYPIQGNNSIILNASGEALAGNNSSLYIAPIQKVQDSNQTRLSYNPVTKEVTYNDTGLYLSGDSVLPSNSEIELGSSSSYMKTAYVDKVILKDNIFTQNQNGELTPTFPSADQFTQLKNSIDSVNAYWEKRVLALEEYIRILEQTYKIKEISTSIPYVYSGGYQNALPNNFTLGFESRIVTTSGSGVVISIDNYTYNAFSNKLTVYGSDNSLITTLIKGDFNSIVRTASVMFNENMLPLSFKLEDLDANIMMTKTLDSQSYFSLTF